jgi:excisionase family DNA binding protein
MPTSTQAVRATHSADDRAVPMRLSVPLDRWGELPAVITVAEAAVLLGLSRSSAYRAAERGELPVIRLGGRMRVPVARLQALVGLTQRATTPQPAPPLASTGS